MNQYCNKIKLPYDPLVEEYNIYEQTVPIKIIDLMYLNPDLKSLLSKLNVHVSFIECFYRPPFNVGGIHLDSDGGDFSKLNWIYHGEGSYMEWFEPLPGKQPISKLTPANTRFMEYNQKDVLLVEKQYLSGSYLLQVGVPHRVKNHLKPRYCVCLILSNADNQRLTMAQAQDILKDYIETT